MARYGLSTTKTTGAAAGMIVQIRTGAARDINIWEIGVFLSTAVSATIGVQRASNPGATFTSTGTGGNEDPIVSSGVAVLDTVAGTPPTIATQWLRQAVLPATIGAGIVWTFPTGLKVPVSNSMTLWQNSTAAVGYVVYFAYDE